VVCCARALVGEDRLDLHAWGWLVAREVAMHFSPASVGLDGSCIHVPSFSIGAVHYLEARYPNRTFTQFQALCDPAPAFGPVCFSPASAQDAFIRIKNPFSLCPPEHLGGDLCRSSRLWSAKEENNYWLWLTFGAFVH